MGNIQLDWGLLVMVFYEIENDGYQLFDEMQQCNSWLFLWMDINQRIHVNEEENNF